MINSRLNEEHVQLLLRQAYCRNLLETNRRICAFVRQLRGVYADCERYRYYHLLVGSTPTARSRELDFPRAEVEHFLESLSDLPTCH